MKRSLSIVIPNYNGKHLLEAYLPSVIVAAEETGLPYEIIIVDDASADGSKDFVRKAYPQISLLENPINQGFSYTCNRGIQAALFSHILLLNSDVKLSPDYFKAQWHYFDLKDTFGVMGRIMTADGSKIEDAARLLEFSGCRIKASRFFYSEDPSSGLLTAYLSGANALIDAEKLKLIGGFDEIYSPFSSEDFDLSLRAWQLGWKCYYEHQSVCFHQVSGSTRTQLKSDFIKKVYYRNRFILQKIHLRGLRGFFLPAQLLLTEVIPKILLGKKWISESYRCYLQESARIRESRNRLENLQRRLKHVSLAEVAGQISASASAPGVREI
ncbi:glycosyltransferase family 2 protein [Pedobacter sp. SYP-B3415]|uniref:glycosyltransferase family 2 protein n=1 Tax=Pedobacter sp. SYP-B3415 TaxID=2496641 RepID=UPI00101BC954|nr:glycosyltransferase family 2 protein [Pedobacter sp. SYP-B3415]